MNFSQRSFVTGLIVLSLGIGFGGGIWFDRNSPLIFKGTFKNILKKDFQKPDEVDFSLFWQVWDSLHKKYVDHDKFETSKLIYGAITGMVNSVGDPYTTFFEPEINKKFQEEIEGTFGGVGMEIGKRNNILTVITPIKNTPAARAGIKAGDKILKIDGKTTTDLSVEEAVNLIRGNVGTKVSLLISNSTQRTIELVRETIKIPTVDIKFLNNDETAYIAIYSFNKTVDSEFKKAAQQVINSQAKRLIIDLRNNPGGLLDSSVNIAGWFLTVRSLVTTEAFGDSTKNEFRTNGNAALKHMPTVVLINGGSASAAEILAGALHDNRGIKLIGEKSYGKGSVQQVDEFSDGSSLKVTVAKWLTPHGVSISEKGLAADVEIKIEERETSDGSIEFGNPGKDPQLDKAIEVVSRL